MVSPKQDGRTTLQAVSDALLVRLEKANRRGTGCHLTADMVRVLGRSSLGEAMAQAYVEQAAASSTVHQEPLTGQEDISSCARSAYGFDEKSHGGCPQPNDACLMQVEETTPPTVDVQDAEAYGPWYPAVLVLRDRYGTVRADRIYQVGKDADLRSSAHAKLIDAAREAKGCS